MHIVMMTYAVRSQKIISLRSFSSTYKLKRWQVWLSPYCVLKRLWRKRQQRGPRKVRVKLFDHLKLPGGIVTVVHGWSWGWVCILSHDKIRFSWILTPDVSWSLGVQMLSFERSGERSRVFKGCPLWGSPGGPVAETLNSQYRAPSQVPSLVGELDPTCGT